MKFLELLELLLAGAADDDPRVIDEVDAFIEAAQYGCCEDPYLCRRVLDILEEYPGLEVPRRILLLFVRLWGKLEKRASTVPWCFEDLGNMLVVARFFVLGLCAN